MGTAVLCALLQTTISSAQEAHSGWITVRTGTAVINGRVTTAENRQPLARASVDLSSGQNRWGLLTDEHGQFEFTGLPAGRYVVSASAAGYLPSGTANLVRPITREGSLCAKAKSVPASICCYRRVRSYP